MGLCYVITIGLMLRASSRNESMEFYPGRSFPEATGGFCEFQEGRFVPPHEYELQDAVRKSSRAHRQQN